MKIILRDELRTRLQSAAHNGSVIAQDILLELKKSRNTSQTISGHANYFATKRKKQSASEGYSKMKIVFTYCNKDITNEHFPDRNNPQAPWFNENRVEVEPSTFIDCFKNLPHYTDEEREYFANAICVMSKVSVKLYSQMKDFEYAYNAENYTPWMQYGDSSLHNSCMRHEQTARNAADFYYNFAGAKIIIAKDSDNCILGRAVVWPVTDHLHGGEVYNFSVLDRVYYSHSFVMKMITSHAQQIGINLRKRSNDYSSMDSFVVMNALEGTNTFVGKECENIHLSINVPASKWHKVGAPYMDTFAFIAAGENNTLTLSNYESRKDIAKCRSTSGYADRCRYYCPSCGSLHYETGVLCSACSSILVKPSLVGTYVTEKMVQYKKEFVPASFLQGKRPTAKFGLYLQIRKLFSK